MPIHVGTEIIVPSEETFKEIAFHIVGAAFDVHDEFGTLFSERLYKMEIADAYRKVAGHLVELEVPIQFIHADFVKSYYADLLVAGGALFEFKKRKSLIEENRCQTFHYLFALGLPRSKLINLGSPSVEHEFVSTTLTHVERKRFFVDRSRWQPVSAECLGFAQRFIAVVEDWGAFLDVSLYEEAMIHFSGGEAQVIQEIPVIRSGETIGKQEANLLTPDIAFRITAIRNELRMMERQLQSFLKHTPLRAIQWVNIYQHQLTFTTLLAGNLRPQQVSGNTPI